MQAGTLISSDVMALRSFVRVDGVERAHESWSIVRDIVSELPAQVVAGGGVRQATGTIKWADQGDVSDGSLNPWNSSSGWVPVSGQRVEIWAGDGTTWWKQFDGCVDEATGEIGAGMESSIVGFDDNLNRTIEHSTVFATHPATVEGGAWCGVAMGPGYVVDRAMRACGYYATPPMRPGPVVSVPAQLSMWAEWGVVRESAYPDRQTDDYGWWIKTCNALYAPYVTPARTVPVELTMMVSPTHAGITTLSAVYGPDVINLIVTAARGVIVRLNSTAATSLPSMGADTVVSLLVKNGVWTIRTASYTATGNLTIPSGAALSGVRVVATGNSMTSGFQVSTPSAAEEFGSITFTPNYSYKIRSLSGTMGVLPSYQLRPAIDVIDEISKSTLTPFWIDELGKAKMIASDVLRSQPPAQTVTTLDDITKLSWHINQLDTRSKVTVKYRRYAIARSIYSSITLWQGSGDSMVSNETKSLFATEPADEDWAEIGGGDGTMDSFNRGRGTWCSGYLEDSTGAWSPIPAGVADFYAPQSIGTETKMFQIDTHAVPAGKTLVLKTPDDAVNYTQRMRGQNYPILRGRGKAAWTDDSVESAIRGPSSSPELIHDTRHWVSQDTNEHQLRIADYIAGQVTAPSPTITGMEVVYDPRRQLGDVITISSPTYMGVTMTALIVGVRNAAGDSFTQSLDVRIITAKSTFTTYAEYEKAIPDGLTYAQWQALGPLPQTYKEFNTAT